jgi:crotonobetainyl-CoA:carnitine CoA-transferase CaiB-like acyl-CoA transferase
VIEQATGMASVTGPPDRPMHPGGLADPVIGMHAAVAVQAALTHRDRTGEGQLIEVAQLETGANLAAELVLEWSAHQRALPRVGNRHPRHAPQGVYAARPGPRGPEWVAVTVADDQQWRALASALERPDWLADAELGDVDGRHARHDELDAGLAAWAADRPVDELVDALVRRGIPATRVLTIPWMFDDPQLAARGYYVPLDHPRVGVRRYPGWPVRFSFTDVAHRAGAPTLGQHNRSVLAGDLDLDAAALAALADAGVIGDRLPGG